MAKHAVNDLGDASENAAAKQDAAAASTTFFDSVLGGLNDVMGASIPLFGGMSAPLIALPVIVGAAAAAVVALADALGTVIAIASAFVAPISLITGLVGGLGLGFAVAAKQAFGMHEDGFGQAISGLRDQFSQLTKTLVGDFMPVFQFLIHNAHDALDFLNRIAKLPLDQAFRQLAQQGVPAVTKFFEQIGHLAARPIRLAFQIAFGQGKGAGEANAAVAQMWNQFTDFLFGYTKTHPVRLASGQVIQLDRRHVDGIFQPLIDWFNRHHFTKEGIKLGHEMLNGFIASGGAQRMSQFLVRVMSDGINTVSRRAQSQLGTNSVSFITAHWRRIGQVIVDLVNPLSHVADFIVSRWGGAITRVRDRIYSGIGGAINTVIGIAHRFMGVLNQIAGFFSRVFTFRVDWPSPPGWLNSVIGGAGDIVGKIPHSLPSLPGGGSGTVPWAMSGGNVVVVNHFHSVDITTHSQRARVAHQLGDQIFRQINQQTGV